MEITDKDEVVQNEEEGSTQTKPIVLVDEPLKSTIKTEFLETSASDETSSSSITAPPISSTLIPSLTSSLATQLCPLGPKDRCTPSQAQAMGQQVLSLMVMHENNKLSLPYELQNTFDIFHRCLAVAYGTFFLHLYTKANAPCLLCHGCKSLYPPGQYIHHACPALPPNIVPCRSRMWRRCLIPLVSSDIDKTQQKERWKYVLEKFSHSNMGVVRRSRLPLETETNLLEMPECKRGRFVKPPLADGVLQVKAPVVSLIPSPTDSANNASLDELDDHQDDEVVDGGGTGEPSSKLICDVTKPQNKAVELIQELFKEINRLGEELMAAQTNLEIAEKKLSTLASSNSIAMSEQLKQSLLAQEKLRTERDDAVKRASEAEQKVERLEKHFKKIQKLQDEALLLTL